MSEIALKGALPETVEQVTNREDILGSPAVTTSDSFADLSVTVPSKNNQSLSSRGLRKGERKGGGGKEHRRMTVGRG